MLGKNGMSVVTEDEKDDSITASKRIDKEERHSQEYYFTRKIEVLMVVYEM